MVEAAIVISMLILGLMGLMFFRTFYVKQMTASRLARASILAYSMTGCEGQVPLDWIGRKDKIDLTVSAPDANSEPATGENQSQSASSSDSGANDFLGGLGLSGDGRGVLNPITNSNLTGKASIESKPGLLAARKTIFSGDIHSRSFVTCGDRVREGNVGDLVSSLMGKLTGLVRF